MFFWTALLTSVLTSENHLCLKQSILYIRPMVKIYHSVTNSIRSFTILSGIGPINSKILLVLGFKSKATTPWLILSGNQVLLGYYEGLHIWESR